MYKKIEIGLLAMLTLLDAYLIGHPNLLGKFGLWFYKYEMINSFPKALATVSVTIVISYFITQLLKAQKDKSWAKWVLICLLGLSCGILITVFFKFNTGTYSHTGKLFIYGMHLLPLLLIYVFGSGIFGYLGNNNIK